MYQLQWPFFCRTRTFDTLSRFADNRPHSVGLLNAGLLFVVKYFYIVVMLLLLKERV